MCSVTLDSAALLSVAAWPSQPFEGNDIMLIRPTHVQIISSRLSRLLLIAMAVLLLLTLVARAPLAAAAPPTPTLLDINHIGAGSNPANLANVNGVLYFQANDGTHGRELWMSDGSVAGTSLVKDIAPGAIHSNPSNLTNVAGVLYFTTDDGCMALSCGRAMALPPALRCSRTLFLA
jgi:ELWxxDGT repeat protein